MKIYLLLTVMLVALMGCTTTYKGSVKGASNQEPLKSGSTLVSQTGSTHAGAVTLR